MLCYTGAKPGAYQSLSCRRKQNWPGEPANFFYLLLLDSKQTVSELVNAVLDIFLGVANGLLDFPLGFVGLSLALLRLVANQLAGLLLDFTGGFFQSALDLVLVHDAPFNDIWKIP